MKKLALLLALAIFALAACADNTTPNDDAQATPSPTETPSRTASANPTPSEAPQDDDFPQSDRTPAIGILEDDERVMSGVRFSGYVIFPTDAAEIFRILSTMPAEEVLTPSHLESQQSDPMFTIFIDYEDGSEETVYSTETGLFFFRYTGTFSDDGDPGYVGGFSEELFDILDALQ